MSRVFTLDSGQAHETDLEHVCALPARAAFLWVHVDGTQDSVNEIAARVTHIPPAALGALKASETRPRATQVDGGALINMRGLGGDVAADGDPLVSIRLWVEQGVAVSLSYRPLAALDRVVDLMLGGKLCDPGDLIVALAMEITEDLDPYIAELGDQLDMIESHVMEEGQLGIRQRVARLRADAISYRRFLSPQRQMMERLIALPADWLDVDDRLHIQEAADRCARIVEELEAVRERAALTHEALTDLRAEHMNKQALILAIVALLFLPLTFVTGLLGMNVEGIPFAREPWAFWGVVAFCTFVAMLLGLWFKLTHWLHK